jgi:pyruvate/2-oxoglutarate dehydrogenase complex dihydrolipoamide dehydrogenase (E3) component
VFGAGAAGKGMAWSMAKAGRRTAVVERKYIGGACRNVACLPSKNVIYTAKVASLVARRREFGIETGQTNHRRVGGLCAQTRNGRCVRQKSIWRNSAGREMNSFSAMAGSSRLAPFMSHCGMAENALFAADRVFVDLGTHATVPDTPGLRQAKPLTHIEALDLQQRPEHLIVPGGG